MKIFEKKTLLIAYLTVCLYLMGYCYYEGLAIGLGTGISVLDVGYLDVLLHSLLGVGTFILIVLGLYSAWFFRKQINSFLDWLVYTVLRMFGILLIARWIKGRKKTGESKSINDSEIDLIYARNLLIISGFILLPAYCCEGTNEKGKEHAKLILELPLEKRAVVVMKEPKDLGTLYYLTTIGNKAICTDDKESRLVISNDEASIIKIRGNKNERRKLAPVSMRP